jgi:DNA helicase-2/ATP-dependent DNA helicase PcrA
MESGSRPSTVQSNGRKLIHMNQATRSSRAPQPAPPRENFTPSDPMLIKVGTRVEHPRFGIGEVHALEGADSNIKATVLFPIGTKQLLLKFAKLRVVE